MTEKVIDDPFGLVGVEVQQAEVLVAVNGLPFHLLVDANAIAEEIGERLSQCTAVAPGQVDVATKICVEKDLAAQRRICAVQLVGLPMINRIVSDDTQKD